MREQVAAWSKARIQRGIEAGHVIAVSRREPPAEWLEHGARTKYWGSCECGWKSTARFTQKVALMAAVHHLTQVLDDPDNLPKIAQRDGVSLPGSVPADL